MIKITRRSGIPVMEQNDHNGMEYLTFPALSSLDWLVHCFTTRTGGVSEGIYSKSNFSYTRGDDPKHVDENCMRIADALGFGRTLDHFVSAVQTHTANIRKVTEADAGKGFTKEHDYTDIDGLITDVPGIILTTYHADCPPVYFADPIRHAIGLSHSGWKGTVKQISRNTIAEMNRNYGTDPANLICAIGPSICRDCYEVSEDVALQFKDVFEDTENIIFPVKEKTGKYLLDLHHAIRETLINAGVKPENIHVTDICTRCNPDYLFSHRINGFDRGNMAAMLAIKRSF